MTKDEIIGWNHQLNGHEFEQASGDGDREAWRAVGWGGKESDRTEQLNNNHHIQSTRKSCRSAQKYILPYFSSGLLK